MRREQTAFIYPIGYEGFEDPEMVMLVGKSYLRREEMDIVMSHTVQHIVICTFDCSFLHATLNPFCTEMALLRPGWDGLRKAAN
jgi:hypothetical protein